MDNNSKSNIRNFAIIAHIDHGKSTLADRLLEITNTIEPRKMREQFLDSHPLERERGITIKMTPVTMDYQLQTTNYQLNLIDTPGHIDFNYEVSRALAAVEGAVLLVDALQGVQAQTIGNLDLARRLGLKIIPAINKIDKADEAQIQNTEKELKNLGFSEEEIIRVSAKTGLGVKDLIKAVIEKMPSPKFHFGYPQALIFDYEYSDHRGLIGYVRLKKGGIKSGESLVFANAKEKFIVQEVGIFKPEFKPKKELVAGEIGYVVTNIKELKKFRVGETIVSEKNLEDILAGYEAQKPVVFSNIYPKEASHFEELKTSLEKMWLSDNSFTFELDSNSLFGRGFKLGFLGGLHLEIILERLRRDFGQELVLTEPSVVFEITDKKGESRLIYSAAEFPDYYNIKKAKEPFIEAEIILPSAHLNNVILLLQNFKGEVKEVGDFGSDRLKLSVILALRDFIKNFYAELQSVSQGFASLSYKIAGFKENDLTRLDLLINNERIVPFSKVILKNEAERSAKAVVEKAVSAIPKTLYEQRIQAAVGGNILASRKIPALKKDVTGYLYGGDRTRKMKLWQKQKRGKKKLLERAKIDIPQEAFFKMLK